jgi:hypothetical protein
MLAIGDWVRRDDPDPEVERWHLVESVISHAAITRCGKRMEPEVDGKGLEVSPVEPLTRMIGQPQNCQTCSSLQRPHKPMAAT